MFLPVPPIDGRAMGYPIEEALEQTRQNLKRDLPWFGGAKHPLKKHFIIVGGGPSLLDQISQIRARKKKGIVVACNGAANTLIKHGIKPEFIAFMDPQPNMEMFVGQNVGSTYLVAAMCHPDLFEALKLRRVIVWHPDLDSEAQREIYLNQPRPFLSIPGAGTVCLRMLNLGYFAGYRSFHMYGVDSSYREPGKDHAYQKPWGLEPEPLTIRMKDKEYLCSPWMVRQAEEFRREYKVFVADLGCRITAHGDGLIPDICAEFNRAVRGVT